MWVLSTSRDGKNLFGMILFSVLFYVETIRLYVFDSPAALQNIFHREMTLIDDLTNVYLKKSKELNRLEQNVNNIRKKTRGQVSYQYYRLHKKRSQNCYARYQNDNELDVNNENRQKSSSFRSNFFSKEPSADVFNGAVDGLLMLHHVYNLDFSNVVTEVEDVRNATANYHKILTAKMLTYFDLILLSVRAITAVWYYNAIQILDIADKRFQGSSSLKRKLSHFHHLFVPYLTFIAKNGILMQQTDPTFDIDSRLFPFSTSRFDHGRCNKS